MACLGVHRPKRVSERYESLAGDLEARRVKYLFRRHLGVEPEDTPKLPWWKYRLYLDGIAWEFFENQEQQTGDGSLDDLAEQGFTVNTITV